MATVGIRVLTAYQLYQVIQCNYTPGRPHHTWLAPWKQISNLLTLASTQHANTLRI